VGLIFVQMLDRPGPLLLSVPIAVVSTLPPPLLAFKVMHLFHVVPMTIPLHRVIPDLIRHRI
jgi:hypothetical protein